MIAVFTLISLSPLPRLIGKEKVKLTVAIINHCKGLLKVWCLIEGTGTGYFNDNKNFRPEDEKDRRPKFQINSKSRRGEGYDFVFDENEEKPTKYEEIPKKSRYIDVRKDQDREDFFKKDNRKEEVKPYKRDRSNERPRDRTNEHQRDRSGERKPHRDRSGEKKPHRDRSGERKPHRDRSGDRKSHRDRSGDRNRQRDHEKSSHRSDDRDENTSGKKSHKKDCERSEDRHQQKHRR